MRWRRERLARFAMEHLDARRCLSPEARALVLGGKKLRSQMLFAAAPPVVDEEVERRLIAAAAAIELLHAGSLIHDDVVDCCALRRGVPAVHARHGEPAAAQSGAFVMHVATTLLGGLPDLVRARFAATARAVARGQLAEIARSHDASVTPRERIAIMEGKTAAVFALACELGGRLSGVRDSAAAALGRLGNGMGLVFQIADDVEDLFASARELGRTPGADLRAGVLSLPLLFAVRPAAGGDGGRLLAEARAAAQRGADGDGEPRLKALLRECGAAGRTLALARALAQDASGELAELRREGAVHAGVSWVVALLGDLVLRIEQRLEV